MERSCCVCPAAITECNGHVLARDLVEFFAAGWTAEAARKVRELCPRCCLRMSIMAQRENVSFEIILDQKLPLGKAAWADPNRALPAGPI